MRNSTPLLLLLTACLTWPFLAPATNPLIVDDADPSLPGEVWVDASAGLAAYDNHRDWDMPLCVAYGLATNLEISVLSGVHRLTAEDNDGNHGHVLGHNDLWLGAKWRFCEEDGLLPRQVLEPSVKLPTAATRHGQGSGTMGFSWLYDTKGAP